MTILSQQIYLGCALVVLLTLINMAPNADAIGCFVCSSINGSEPDCEDKFNSTKKFYKPICYAGRKGRSGLFPGTDCIKMKAELEETGYTIVVRDCAVDNGDVNSDTEIGRETHCWMVNMIEFDGKQMSGCALACDTDGCNGAPDVTSQRLTLISLLCMTFGVLFCRLLP